MHVVVPWGWGRVLLFHARCFFPRVENLLALLPHSLTLPREEERVFYLMCWSVCANVGVGVSMSVWLCVVWVYVNEFLVCVWYGCVCVCCTQRCVWVCCVHTHECISVFVVCVHIWGVSVYMCVRVYVSICECVGVCGVSVYEWISGVCECVV